MTIPTWCVAIAKGVLERLADGNANFSPRQAEYGGVTDDARFVIGGDWGTVSLAGDGVAFCRAIARSPAMISAVLSNQLALLQFWRGQPGFQAWVTPGVTDSQHKPVEPFAGGADAQPAGPSPSPASVAAPGVATSGQGVSVYCHGDVATLPFTLTARFISDCPEGLIVSLAAEGPVNEGD